MTTQAIIREVANAFGLSPDVVLSRLRNNYVILCRHTAMMMSREFQELPFQHIGYEFGRDHGSVLYGIESLKEKLLKDPKLAAKVGLIRATIVSAIAAESRKGKTAENRLRPRLAAAMAFTGRLTKRATSSSP